MHDGASYVSAKFDVILCVRFSDKVSKVVTTEYKDKVASPVAL